MVINVFRIEKIIDSRFIGQTGGQTSDVINIYFIILYIIKKLKINKFYLNCY